MSDKKKEQDDIDKLFEKLNGANCDISSCKDDYLKLLDSTKGNDFSWELNVIFNRFEEYRRQELLKEDDYTSLKSKFDNLNLSQAHEYEVEFRQALGKSNISKLEDDKNNSIEWEQKNFEQPKSVKNKISRIFFVLTILVVLVVLVLAICYLCIGGDIWTFLTKE